MEECTRVETVPTVQFVNDVDGMDLNDDGKPKDAGKDRGEHDFTGA